MLTHFPKAVPEIPVSDADLDQNQLRVFYDFASDPPKEHA
jgi:hypothetical protein